MRLIDADKAIKHLTKARMIGDSRPMTEIFAEIPSVEVLDKIRDEIERKAHSGQWSDATMYGMLKAVAIIDRYKAEVRDKE